MARKKLACGKIQIQTPEGRHLPATSWGETSGKREGEMQKESEREQKKKSEWHIFLKIQMQIPKNKYFEYVYKKLYRIHQSILNLSRSKCQVVGLYSRCPCRMYMCLLLSIWNELFQDSLLPVVAKQRYRLQHTQTHTRRSR